jgi:hypothetical protein
MCKVGVRYLYRQAGRHAGQWNDCNGSRWRWRCCTGGNLLEYRYLYVPRGLRGVSALPLLDPWLPICWNGRLKSSVAQTDRRVSISHIWCELNRRRSSTWKKLQYSERLHREYSIIAIDIAIVIRSDADADADTLLMGLTSARWKQVDTIRQSVLFTPTKIESYGFMNSPTLHQP